MEPAVELPLAPSCAGVRVIGTPWVTCNQVAEVSVPAWAAAARSRAAAAKHAASTRVRIVSPSAPTGTQAQCPEPRRAVRPVNLSRSQRFLWEVGSLAAADGKARSAAVEHRFRAGGYPPSSRSTIDLPSIVVA